MLVVSQGPVTKRPGTRFVALSKDKNLPIRIIPFEYSTDDSYVLELGNEYIRFCRNGGVIETSNIDSTPYEISTVYETNDLFNIQYAQSDNQMYLVDGDHIPQKLSRSGHTEWTIEDCNFTTGPFLPANIEDINVTPSGVTGSITLIADANIFYTGHVGSIWMINQKRSDQVLKETLSTNTYSSSTGSFTGAYSFTTSGTWNGTVTLERKPNNSTIWIPALSSLTSTNFDNPAESEASGAIYRVKMEGLTSGSCAFVFTIGDPLNHGIVKITDYVDANEVDAEVITPLEDTNSTMQWREGYWSSYRGWPKTVEFHQQRLVFGGSETFPQTIWFGKANPDDYENFTEGTLDTSAFTIALSGQNPIQWLLSQDYFFIGTSGSVGKYGEQGKAVTPTSPNYREQSRAGSANIKAVLAGDALLYVERGGTKVRELVYSLAMDKYLSPDLTILAEDITRSGIKNIAFQVRPDPMLWCVLNDGNMTVLTYQKDQEVIGWTLHNTYGTFESVCRIPGIPGTSEDEIWVIVKRDTSFGRDADPNYGDGLYGSGLYVGTVLYYNIEQFQPRYWSDVNECWFVDSGLTYSGEPNDTFRGLDHLFGKTVSVYADGLTQSNEVVDVNGAVTIDRAAGNVTIGLPFVSKLETLPLRVDPQDSAMNKKIKEINIDFWLTGSCRYGNGSSSDLTTINFKNSVAVDPNATFQELYSSIISPKRLLWPYGSMRKATVYIDSNEPMPLTIRSIQTSYDIIP